MPLKVPASQLTLANKHAMARKAKTKDLGNRVFMVVLWWSLFEIIELGADSANPVRFLATSSSILSALCRTTEDWHLTLPEHSLDLGLRCFAHL